MIATPQVLKRQPCYFATSSTLRPRRGANNYANLLNLVQEYDAIVALSSPYNSRVICHRRRAISRCYIVWPSRGFREYIAAHSILMAPTRCRQMATWINCLATIVHHVHPMSSGQWFAQSKQRGLSRSRFTITSDGTPPSRGHYTH